jgi:hypothetical protein
MMRNLFECGTKLLKTDKKTFKFWIIIGKYACALWNNLSDEIKYRLV